MRTAFALALAFARLLAALAAEAAVFAAGRRFLFLALGLVVGFKVADVHPFATAHLQNTTVSCATTVTEINPSSNTASMYVANSSATCVRVGGKTVTTGTGASIGSGCRDGSGITLAFNAATCISTSGAPVVVDVVYEDN